MGGEGRIGASVSEAYIYLAFFCYLQYILKILVLLFYFQFLMVFSTGESVLGI